MAESTTKQTNVDQQELPQLLGHPKGLFYLFFAELWERFSFYGMRALLTLYMVNELFKDLQDGETKGLGIYAAYGALVYFTPLIGGMIADTLIGYRKSIILGGALMTLGHFIMAFQSEFWFFTALGLLIVGNGFFKPNISTLVGTLYNDGDVRRDAGFTIFYMAINIGAWASPLVCGWLGYAYGWHYGFGAAGVGMFVGLVFFWSGGRSGVFGNNGLQPEKFREKKFAGLNVYYPIILLAFLMVPLFATMVYHNEAIMGNVLTGVAIVVSAYIGYLCIFVLDKVARGRVLVIVFITLLLTVFWSFFEQAGSSLTLFAQRNVNLSLINAAQTNSINPGYIILLAIPFAMMWTSLSQKGKNPRTPLKYALGIAQLGLGFLIFAWSARYMDISGRVPMLFLMVGWFVITTGELFVSPIGLSKVTELSPKHMTAFFMGVFFLSSAFAHHIAGVIAKLTVQKESVESYEPQNDIFTRMTSTLSGNDLNAVGEFEFQYSKAYNEIALPEVTAYPNMEKLEKYNSTLEDMGNMNDTWKKASINIKAHAAEVKSALTSLLQYSSDSTGKMLPMYEQYNSKYQEMVNQRSIKNSYELFKNQENMKPQVFDKEIKKVTDKYKVKAEELIALEKEMAALNPDWANSARNFNEKLEANRQMVRPIIGLSTYAKIFSQIALISFIVAFMTLLISPLIKRWMHGIQ